MPRRKGKGKPDKPPGKPQKPIDCCGAAAGLSLSASSAVVYIGWLHQLPRFDSMIITFDNTEYTMDAAA